MNYQAAKDKGVKALGTRDAGGLSTLAALADLAAAGMLTIPIGATFALDEVQDAYQALRDRDVYGRIVLHPQETA